MQDTLITVHRITGYAVFVLVIVVALRGFAERRSWREFSAGPYVLGSVALDIQVLIGIVLYGVGQYWEGSEALQIYVHPAVMFLALGVAHVGIGRARRESMAAEAHKRASVALLVAAVLAGIGIGLATVA